MDIRGAGVGGARERDHGRLRQCSYEATQTVADTRTGGTHSTGGRRRILYYVFGLVAHRGARTPARGEQQCSAELKAVRNHEEQRLRGGQRCLGFHPERFGSYGALESYRAPDLL